MENFKTSKAQRKSANKWNKENTAQIGIRAKKEEIAIFKEYAEKLSITPSRFAILAMHYCINNNIELRKEDK